MGNQKTDNIESPQRRWKDGPKKKNNNKKTKTKQNKPNTHFFRVILLSIYLSELRETN